MIGQARGVSGDAEASRFLAQTTYGATEAEISRVRALGYSQWIDQQMVTPAPPGHLADMEARLAQLRDRQAELRKRQAALQSEVASLIEKLEF